MIKQRFNESDTEYLERIINLFEGESHVGTGGIGDCIRCKIVDKLRELKDD